MVIFATNCYENLGGAGAKAFSYATEIYLKCIFLAITSGVSFKSNVVCVCMYQTLAKCPLHHFVVFL